MSLSGNASSPQEIGALCRFAREQAGVSLREMALRTHRDVSSLSRFERGQVTPRDRERLLGDYRALGRASLPAQQRASAPKKWPLIYLGASISAALFAVPFAPPQANDEITRVWLAASLLVLALSRAPLARRASKTGHIHAAVGNLSYALLLCGLAANNVLRMGRPVLWPVLALVMPAVLLGLVALAFPYTAPPRPEARRE